MLAQEAARNSRFYVSEGRVYESATLGDGNSVFHVGSFVANVGGDRTAQSRDTPLSALTGARSKDSVCDLWDR